MATTPQLRTDLKQLEGLRLTAYPDTVGRWTIGYGHANGVLPGTVWTEEQAEVALEADIAKAEGNLDRYLPFWRTMTDRRQDALCNLCFNMGIGTLLTFRVFLGFMRSGDYADAASDLQGTKWAQQVHEARVSVITKGIVNG